MPRSTKPPPPTATANVVAGDNAAQEQPAKRPRTGDADGAAGGRRRATAAQAALAMKRHVQEQTSDDDGGSDESTAEAAATAGAGGKPRQPKNAARTTADAQLLSLLTAKPSATATTRGNMETNVKNVHTKKQVPVDVRERAWHRAEHKLELLRKPVDCADDPPTPRMRRAFFVDPASGNREDRDLVFLESFWGELPDGFTHEELREETVVDVVKTFHLRVSRPNLDDLALGWEHIDLPHPRSHEFVLSDPKVPDFKGVHAQHKKDDAEYYRRYNQVKREFAERAKAVEQQWTRRTEWLVSANRQGTIPSIDDLGPWKYGDKKDLPRVQSDVTWSVGCTIAGRPARISGYPQYARTIEPTLCRLTIKAEMNEDRHRVERWHARLRQYISLKALRAIKQPINVRRLMQSGGSCVWRVEPLEFHTPQAPENDRMLEDGTFKLQLRDYQRRALAWLVDLETHADHQYVRVQLREVNVDGFMSHFLDYHDVAMFSKTSTRNGDRRAGPSSGNDRRRANLLSKNDHVARDLYVVRMGDTDAYVKCGGSSEVLTIGDPMKMLPILEYSIPCAGAILADKPGTGKTIVALALIQKLPFRSVNDLPWGTPDEHKTYWVSRATLIVCPSHLAKQWYKEAKRCIPNVHVHLLCTILDYRKLSWWDVMSADVVIVSVAFLQNSNYTRRRDELVGRMSHRVRKYVENTKKSKDLKKELRVPGTFVFEGVYWHRLVCDEFHELAQGEAANISAARKTFLRSLKARFYLGLTGTPQYKSLEDVVTMAEYLRVDLPHRLAACNAFLRDRVRRNEPNLALPPLTQHLIWVTMTAQEKGLYETLRDNLGQALMACNHYQVADEIVELAGREECLTIDQVAERVQAGRLKETQKCRQDIEGKQKVLQELEEKLKEHQLKKEKDKEQALKQSKERHEANLLALKKRLQHVQSQYNYFQAVLVSVREVEAQTCPLCLDELAEGARIAVAVCGHIHCAECMQRLFSNGGAKCTICRKVLTREQVDMLVMSKERPVVAAQQDHAKPTVDRSKFGTKLSVFAGYLDELFERKPESKVILFIQFRRLMTLVSKALTNMQVKHVHCTGSVYQRTGAVDAFKKQQDVRLILLSSEDSVSGLHLTEATHVVIFHPFLLGTDREAMDYENQGVARAWRGGQMHPVKVVRFMVRDSIEATVAERRGYKDGVIESLD